MLLNVKSDPQKYPSYITVCSECLEKDPSPKEITEEELENSPEGTQIELIQYKVVEICLDPQQAPEILGIRIFIAGKCWNIIILICRRKTYSGKLLEPSRGKKINQVIWVFKEY